MKRKDIKKQVFDIWKYGVESMIVTAKTSNHGVIKLRIGSSMAENHQSEKRFLEEIADDVRYDGCWNITLY